MARQLPELVLKGKKRGFNVPIPVWLRGELRDMVHDVLHPRRLKETGFFNETVVSQFIHDHEAGHADYSRNIWGLMIFMLWHEQYISSPHADLQLRAVVPSLAAS
jgi:asparagine synthase (glutamine-hydrolysing)